MARLTVAHQAHRLAGIHAVRAIRVPGQGAVLQAGRAATVALGRPHAARQGRPAVPAAPHKRGIPVVPQLHAGEVGGLLAKGLAPVKAGRESAGPSAVNKQPKPPGVPAGGSVGGQAQPWDGVGAWRTGKKVRAP